MIPVTCRHCGHAEDIPPIRAHLEDLTRWHLVWTCHGTPSGVDCGALNRMALRRGKATDYRAAGVQALTHPVLLTEARQDHLEPLTEDEVIELCRVLYLAQDDRLAALARVRLEPEAVR